MTRILLILVLCLVSVSMNAQNQDSFTGVVRKYINDIESAIKDVAPINVKKEAHAYYKTGNLNAAAKLYEKRCVCMIALREFFIAGGDKYRIGQNPSENVMMNISFINSKGERKTQKKKVKDVVDYLCNKAIPADSVKVTSIQVFRIYDIAESAGQSGVFKQNILSIDGYSIFDIDDDGRITEKHDTPCKFTIMHTDELSSWQVEYNINKLDASPLFGNIDVTIWTK